MFTFETWYAMFTFGTWYAELASFMGQLQSILLMQCFSVNYIRCMLPIKRHHQTSCFEWLCLVAMPLPPHMPLKYQKLHFPSKSILIFLQAKWHIACRLQGDRRSAGKGFFVELHYFSCGRTKKCCLNSKKRQNQDNKPPSS